MEVAYGIREVRLVAFSTGGDEVTDRAEWREPPYTEPYVLWCGRTSGRPLLLPDFTHIGKSKKYDFLFDWRAAIMIENEKSLKLLVFQS
jgi:hypothetical protein